MTPNKHDHEPVLSGVIIGCPACHDEMMASMAEWPWLPIDTAPKDGAWVILGGGEVDPHEWPTNTGSGLDADSKPTMVVGMWHKEFADDPGNWVFCYWDSAFRSAYLNPTHWIPLPALPTRSI